MDDTDKLPERSSAQSIPAHITEKQTRLVILDDEAHIIRLLTALIPWQELSIKFEGSAQNGVDGRALILEKKPDIVITDIKMPGRDGLSLIADIHACMPEIDFIIVSGFSQFDYARKAIAYNVENYLLKPINKEELHTTLEKLISKRMNRQQEIIAIQESGEQKKSSLFSRLITESGFQTADTLRKEFGVAPEETARLCIIKVDSAGTVIFSELYHLLADKIAQILRKHTISRAAYFNKDIICFLCVTHSMQQKYLHEKLSLIYFDLQKIAEVFPQLRFTLFYGKEITRDLHQEYALLMQALPLRRVKDASGIIPFETAAVSVFPDALLENWNKKCIKMLDCLDPAVADEITAAFVSELEDYSESQQEEILVAACRRLAVKSEERHPSQENWFSDVVLPSLHLAGTTEELNERFCTEIKKMIAETGAKKTLEIIRPIRQADAYMCEHFMDYDISLETVAETVSLTPSYFSALYKKETGIGFLEALTAVRIKKAKDLLQNTNDTIAKIASSVGYTDIKYFSRIFKKTTGITPNEYRQFYS